MIDNYLRFNKFWMNAYSSDASVMSSAKAIDEYASLRSKAVESNEMVDIDPRLEAIVERMLGKYDSYAFFISLVFVVLQLFLHGFLSADASVMGSINKPWALR